MINFSFHVSFQSFTESCHDGRLTAFLLLVDREILPYIVFQIH